MARIMRYELAGTIAQAIKEHSDGSRIAPFLRELTLLEPTIR